MQLKFTAMAAVALFLPACTSTYDLTPTPKESHPWMEKQYRTYHELLAEAKDDSVEILTRVATMASRTDLLVLFMTPS